MCYYELELTCHLVFYLLQEDAYEKTCQEIYEPPFDEMIAAHIKYGCSSNAIIIFGLPATTIIYFSPLPSLPLPSLPLPLPSPLFPSPSPPLPPLSLPLPFLLSLRCCVEYSNGNLYNACACQMVVVQ